MYAQGFLMRCKYEMYFELTSLMIRLYKIDRTSALHKSQKFNNPTITFALPSLPTPQTKTYIVDAKSPWVVHCFAKDTSYFLEAYPLFTLHLKQPPLCVRLQNPITLITYLEDIGFVIYSKPENDSVCSLFRFDPRQQGRTICRQIQHNAFPFIYKIQVDIIEDYLFLIRGYFKEGGGNYAVCIWVREDKQKFMEIGKINHLTKKGIFDKEMEDVSDALVAVQQMPRYSMNGAKQIHLVRVISQKNQKNRMQLLQTKENYQVDYRFYTYQEQGSLHILLDTTFGIIISEFVFRKLDASSLFCRSQHLLNQYSKESAEIYYNIQDFFSQMQHFFYKTIEKFEVPFSSAGYQQFKLLLNKDASKLNFIFGKSQKSQNWLRILNTYCRQYYEQHYEDFIKNDQNIQNTLQIIENLKQFHQEVSKRTEKYFQKSDYSDFKKIADSLETLTHILYLKKRLFLAQQESLESLGRLFESFSYRRRFLKYAQSKPMVPRLFFEYFQQFSCLISLQPPSLTRFLKILSSSANPFMIKYFTYELLGKMKEEGKERQIIELIIRMERVANSQEEEKLRKSRINQILDSFDVGELPEQLYLYFAGKSFQLGAFSQVVKLLDRVDWIKNFEQVIGYFVSCRQLPRLCERLVRKIRIGLIPVQLQCVVLQKISEVSNFPKTLLESLYHSVSI